MMTTNLRTTRWMAAGVVTMAMVGFASSPVLADLPDRGPELAPADAAVLIELEDLAELRAELARDPLLAYLREQTPARREPGAWRAVQEALDLSGEEIFDRYFGQRVVIIGQDAERGGPAAVLSRVAEADAQRALDRLKLKPVAEAGAFELYRTAGDRGLLAFGNGWFAMGNPKHEDYIRRVLQGIGEVDALGETETFHRWNEKVAEGTFARLFVRDEVEDAVHAAGLERDGGSLALRYAGRSDEASELLRRIGDADALEFGPLPRQTLSATTLNLRDRQPDRRWVELMDRLVAPASYEQDVMPKLGSPVVTFLGEIKGEELEPRAGFSMPVLGMAIKLRDRSVAEDLDRALQGMLLFANLATMQMQLDPIDLHTTEHEGVTFRYADVGKPMSQRLDEPGLRGAVQVAFGRVGDWYVLTTHAKFFRWMIEAEADGAWRIDQTEDVKRMDLVQHERPLATSFLRAPELAAHVRTWLAHIGARQPAWLTDAERDEPETRPGRAVKGLSLFAGVLEHYEGASVQLYGGEEEQTIRMDATLQRQ